MSLRIALDNYYVILTHTLTVILSLFISFYIFILARKNRLLYLYLLTQLLLILWVFSKIFKTSAPSLGLRWTFIIAQYFGICFLGSVFVMFAYTYSYHKAMKLRYAILLNVPPVLLFLVVVTNPLHMKFYSFFDMYRDSFGPLFYFHQTTVYLYLICGIILCSKGFRKQFGVRKVQATLFTIAILLPIAVNLLYIFKVWKRVFGIRLPMDITPISCIASLLIFSIAAYRYRFVDITPLAYKEALRQSHDCILLIDSTHAILERNIAFDRTFGLLIKSSSFSCLEEFLLLLENPAKISGLKQISDVLNPLTNTSVSLELIFPDDTCYNVLIEPVFNRRRKVCGALIRFIDITSRKVLLNTLTEKNRALSEGNDTLEKKAEVLRQLSVEEVRSYMAKEVHDILGHSVVLVLAMLEVAHLNLENGVSKIDSYISHSIEMLKTGLIEIEKSSRENHISMTDNESFFQALSLLAAPLQASGILLELTVQGQSYELERTHTEALYKICREAVTNAVRHGKASVINIILRFYSNCYELYIIDNGVGCTSIVKGLGLKGIETEAAAIGASLRCITGNNEGFQLFLSVQSRS